MPDMRIAEVQSPRHTVVVADASPEPGPEEVLIEVTTSGVCASDVALWNESGRQPNRHGHEFAGQIAALGAAVDDGGDGWQIGDRVTGFGSPAHASRLLVKPNDLVALPASVPLWAGLGEPLACVVSAVERSNIRPGDRIGVIGLGSMGVLAVQVAAAYGAGEVAVSDHDPRRIGRTIDQLGHRVQVTASDGAAGSCDVVIEFSGTASGLSAAGDLTRTLGRLVIGGYHQHGERSLDIDWWYRGLDIVNAFTPDRGLMRRAMKDGMSLAASGAVDLPGLVTHRLPLDRLDDAYALLADRADGFIKAVVEP